MTFDEWYAVAALVAFMFLFSMWGKAHLLAIIQVLLLAMATGAFVILLSRILVLVGQVG